MVTVCHQHASRFFKSLRALGFKKKSINVCICVEDNLCVYVSACVPVCVCVHACTLKHIVYSGVSARVPLFVRFLASVCVCARASVLACVSV